ncbi:MAG: hypothetical protein AAB387_00375 [candidate division NC10 bacterium]
METGGSTLTYCEVRLVDETDRDVPLGTPGELAFRGLTLFSGYWNAPGSSRAIRSRRARARPIMRSAVRGVSAAQR